MEIRSPANESQGQIRRVEVKNIGHVSFQVRDMDAMLRFYGGILGMRQLFTLTVGDIAAKMRQRYGGQLPPEAQEHLRKMGPESAPWMTYLKMADRQFIELFYDMGGSYRTIADRWDSYGYTKVNYEVEDVEALRDRLVETGVTMDEDVHATADGSLEITVHDPDGNEVHFIQSARGDASGISLRDDPDHQVCSAVSYTARAAFQVKDRPGMERFYTEGLGLKKVMTLAYADLFEVGPHQCIELVHTDGQPKKEDRDLSDAYGYQHICLEVEDIRAAWDAVIANGLKPDTEISQGVAGSCQFWLVDPDGNRLELMEYVPGAKQLE